MSNIKSMTGFGRAIFTTGGIDFSVEITSVNQRGLAIGIFVPAEWSSDAERLLTPTVKEYVSRGKVNISVKATSSAGAPVSSVFSWNEEATAQAFENLRNATSKLGIEFNATPELYLRLAELHKQKFAELPSLADESTAKALLKGVKEALEKFIEMRKREGEFLRTDLLSRVQKLKTIVAAIKAESAGTVPAYRDTLLTRLKNMNLQIDINDERFIKEVTIFADRCDISEEETRLASHIEQFETCIEEENCGRKLDFICQEILREFNTIGSKANSVGITRQVVEAKNEQERLREQVQNIE